MLCWLRLADGGKSSELSGSGERTDGILKRCSEFESDLKTKYVVETLQRWTMRYTASPHWFIMIFPIQGKKKEKNVL